MNDKSYKNKDTYLIFKFCMIFYNSTQIEHPKEKNNDIY